VLQQGDEIDMPTIFQSPDKLPDLKTYLSPITTDLSSAETQSGRRVSGDHGTDQADFNPPGTRDGGLSREHSPSPVIAETVNAVVSHTNRGRTQNPELKFGEGLICVWSNTTTSKQVFDEWPKPYDVRCNQNNRGSSKTEIRVLELGDCFEEFSRGEKFEGDEIWFCPECKTFVSTMTTMHLWRVPDILIIQLKRLHPEQNWKVDTFVDFPVTNLDLTDRVRDKSWLQNVSSGSRLVYDLFAVANHSGGLYGGHWTADVQNYLEDPPRWYHFNGFLIYRISFDFVDSFVSMSNEEDLVRSSALLLFYKRKQLHRNEDPMAA